MVGIGQSHNTMVAQKVLLFPIEARSMSGIDVIRGVGAGGGREERCETGSRGILLKYCWRAYTR